MTSDLFRRIERDGVAVDLSSRSKWRVTGTDRVRYLNGQVTNDVRKTRTDGALPACVTNAKGRIEGLMYIHAAPGESLFLDAEPALREPLSARLEKYIVSDDVIIEDVTDGWKLLHLFGAGSEQLMPGPDAIPAGKFRIVRNNRLGIPGCDLWWKAAESPPDLSITRLTPEDAEVWRLCQGIPRWPEELNAGFFPQEAGPETSVMDFSKGCYIGQEVLSRIKTTGRMPRRLVRFQVSDPACKTEMAATPVSLWRLWSRSSDGTHEAGTVTSMCLHPVLDQVIGLAYLREGRERHSLLLTPEDRPGILFEVKLTGI